MGVDVLQGIHLARPMIAADVAPWARRWSAALASAAAVHRGGQVG